LIVPFQAVETNLKSSTLLYTEALRLDSKYLKQLRTHFIYLNYLRRRPEYILSCNYAICNICFQIFELNLENQKLCFRVNKYTICSQKISVVEKVKSVTTDFRILNINNSDTRDIVFLEFLQFLQNIIESAFSIQNLFDQIFDISSNKY